MNIRATMIRTLVATSLVALSMQGMAAAAHAGEAGQTVTRTVHFGDLDVKTVKGLKTLEGRVRVAASQVCREVAPTTSGREANLQCNSRLIRETMAKVSQADAQVVAKRIEVEGQRVARARTP